MLYRIQNSSRPWLMWSDKRGWVLPHAADKYTPERKKTKRLPPDGRWSRVL